MEKKKEMVVRLESQAAVKEDLKTVALGTSKVTVATHMLADERLVLADERLVLADERLVLADGLCGSCEALFWGSSPPRRHAR